MSFVSLLRTTELLSRNVEKVLQAGDVSPNQYNVLRILRGAAEGLPCTEIAQPHDQPRSRHHAACSIAWRNAR